MFGKDHPICRLFVECCILCGKPLLSTKQLMQFCPRGMTLSGAAMSEMLKKAKEGALWGAAIADELSMPVHWYYNPDDIKYDYNGWLTGYRAPNKYHPSSILTLSDADGEFLVL